MAEEGEEGGGATFETSRILTRFGFTFSILRFGWESCVLKLELIEILTDSELFVEVYE